MSKHKNQRIICSDIAQFKRLSDEYRTYTGRDIVTNVSTLEITVLSLPRNFKRKAMKERKIQRLRLERDSAYGYGEENDYSEYSDRDY